MKIKFGDNSLNLKVDGSLANIDRGPRGYSAYEIAVQEGFVGTEEEWLASLVGPEGKQGKDGERGIQGPRGQQGDKGDKGDTGPQGDKGDRGDTGPQGDKGDIGPQGEKGATGNGILSIQKTATAGLVDTYTTTFTDGTTTTFDVTNGKDGEVTQEQLDESQAKQDTKIDWLQTLVNQMPRVAGQGTDLSLQDVLNYRLMKFLPQGVSSQDGEPTPTTPIPVKSVTGENSLILQNENLYNKNTSVSEELNGSDGSSSSSNTYCTSDYIRVIPGQDYYLTGKNDGYSNCFYDNNKNFIQTIRKTTGVITVPDNQNIAFIRFNSSKTYKNTIMFVKGSTAPTTYVEHEEQNYLITLKSNNLIGLDTAQYPVDLKVGDKITLTNNNNVALQLNFYTNFGDSERNDYWTVQSERSRTVTVTKDSKAIAWNKLFSGLAWVNKGVTSLSYRPYIANPIELNSSPDGTIRDEIIGTPNNWFKREYIGKTTDASGSTSITINDMVSGSGFYSYYGGTLSGKTITYDSAISGINTIWYQKEQYTDIPITDTALISQLNDIYNNAHSYNGTTNITTTYEDGNEQMYLDIEALAKGGSTTTETDPIFSASASSGITSSDITNWNNKADVEDIPDLTDYVKNTDYARSSKGGVVKVASDSYNVSTSASGQLISVARTYQAYNNMQNNSFISKGTLENVITGKNLADKNYVDTAIATAITNTLGGSF